MMPEDLEEEEPRITPHTPERVAAILSGRIAIYATEKKTHKEGRWAYWRCACGDSGVTGAELPINVDCVVCKRHYLIFDPEKGKSDCSARSDA